MSENKEYSKIPNLPDFSTFGVTWTRVFPVNWLFYMILTDSFSKQFRLRKYSVIPRWLCFPNQKEFVSLVCFWEILWFCTKSMILCKNTYILYPTCLLSLVITIVHTLGNLEIPITRNDCSMKNHMVLMHQSVHVQAILQFL